MNEKDDIKNITIDGVFKLYTASMLEDVKNNPLEAVNKIQEQQAEILKLKLKIDRANDILSTILVVKQGEIFRPIKNTSSQEVYCAICLLNELLETPYRINYNLLKDDK